MSDDRRKSLIVGNLPEETVAVLKDARMPTDAMGDDIVERLRAAGHNALMDEAADEIERLRRTLQLHAGDVASLSGELDEWRERALAAEAENARLREAVTMAANRLDMSVSGDADTQHCIEIALSYLRPPEG